MDAFRSVWTDAVTGAASLKDVFHNEVVPGAVSLKDAFHSEVISKFISKPSAGTLVSRSASGNIGVGEVVLIAATAIQIAVVMVVVMFVLYTLNDVFPVLAMVEEDAPQAYEPVQFSDEPESEKPEKYMDTPDNEEGVMLQSRPATSSLRSTYRLLCETRGFRGVWRGFEYASLQYTSISLITLAFSFLPFGLNVIAYIVPSLLTVQFGVAWTHSVISDPSRNSFWYRLPPFGLAFRATAIPTLVATLVPLITRKVPDLIGRLVAGSWYNAIPFLRLGIWILLWAFVILPNAVVLTRVRASMLPEGDRAIVAFDNALTLHRASGKEYMTMIDAWKSFSRAAWVRLIKLYAKVCAVSFLAFLTIGAIAVGEFFLVQLLFPNH
ncbi:hypothetical protein F4818DRAFT_435752 [Hypoxylon cercidicola]|nr:hypothetical protein F4818DRAFT_435752 [Hypoxylon cercidicola]